MPRPCRLPRPAHRLAALALLGGLAAPPPATAAPTLQVTADGVLTGATNVNVLGRLFDVRFVDGRLGDLFPTRPGVQPARLVAGYSDARTPFAQALLDQVFAPTGGHDFGSDITRILGCGSTAHCVVHSPVDHGSGIFTLERAVNLPGPQGDVTSTTTGTAALDTSAGPGATANVLARWEPAAPTAGATAVPEPGSFALAGLALAGLGLSRRRRG